MTLYLVAEYLGQAVWSLVVALLLFAFHRTYRRPYLKKWALSWGALAVYHAAGALGLRLASWEPAAAPARAVASVLALVAVYAGVVWLLLGTYEVTTGRIASRRGSVRLLVAAAAFGLASAVFFALGPPEMPLRLVLRLVVPPAMAGAAFAASGIGIWRARRQHRGRGPTLLAIAFALYGLQRLHMGALGARLLVGATLPAYMVVLGTVDLLLQSLIALGMAVWMFEEERRRALGAAAQLDRLAAYDPLTEVMNRGSFFASLEAACRVARDRGGRVLVAVVDVNRFKSVNDNFGQAVGDELLRAAAARLRRVVGDSESVARLGGDEFVVMRAATAVPGTEGELAVELKRAFARPFELAGEELPVAVTVGVCRCPDDGVEPEELVRNAGLALVEARKRGEGFHVYTPYMSAAARERLALELELRRVLESDGLDLAYQPVIDTTSGRVERVEALVRWWRQDGREVHPYRFLPIAEVIGLADQLDEWVLRRALSQLARWHAGGHPGLRIAVNLSSQRFQDPSLVQEVEEALRDADVPASCLDLEVTERVAMHRADASLYTMNALQRVGVGLTIDDFGTGYSSLSYLRRLPVSSLKIDRSFVDDLGREGDAARSIVRSILALGCSLGLAVVAEGVETAEQWEVLGQEGCSLVQGYYVAPPCDHATLSGLLARGNLLPDDRAVAS